MRFAKRQLSMDHRVKPGGDEEERAARTDGLILSCSALLRRASKDAAGVSGASSFEARSARTSG